MSGSTFPAAAKPALHRIAATVNGEPAEATVPPRLLLSELLRDRLGLTGTHVGCGTGACGSCTVLVDGAPMRACLMLAVQADGATIETIESVGGPEGLHPVQQAFQDHHALQCGFCTPGIVMAAVSLFREDPQPSPEALDAMLQGHLCRCTGYRNIAEALATLAIPAHPEV